MVSTLNRWITKEYSDLIKDQEGVVVVELEKVTVQEAQEIRNAVRESGAVLRVARNRLAKVALKEIGVPIDDAAFDGICAFLVGDTESTLAAAKAISELWKKGRESTVTFKGGLFDGSILDADQAAGLPALPDRHTLRGMFCSAIIAPARSLAALLLEVPASTARALSARADQGDA